MTDWSGAQYAERSALQCAMVSEALDAPDVPADRARRRRRRLTAAAGSLLEAVTVTDRRWNFGSRGAFEQWCAMGTTAWTDRLPPRMRDEYVTELVTADEPVARAAAEFGTPRCVPR